MSQQGIFSIAPDSQPAQSNGNASGNASPFTAVTENGAQNSPFAAASPSPFQQAQPAQNDDSQRSGIPQRRPEGQPPAMKATQAPGEEPVQEGQVPQQNVFEAVPPQPNGGPFQMNGFPEQTSGQFTEAAPVARAQEDSPFVAVQNDRHDYETAKAELEPQQDFAAVEPRYTPAPAPVQQPAPVKQPDYTPQQQQQPVATPAATSAMATVSGQQPQPTPGQPAPAFQQLELRAIFGVDHVLDQKEIIQRARTLPGVRNVAVVGQQEASALSNFRQAMHSMGFGDSNEMKLNSGGGDVDFLTEGETTIAILHEGAYAPGVQETLIIVAREIGKLS